MSGLARGNEPFIRVRRVDLLRPRVRGVDIALRRSGMRAARKPARTTVPGMATIVLRVRLIGGEHTDLTYEGPQQDDEDGIIDKSSRC